MLNQPGGSLTGSPASNAARRSFVAALPRTEIPLPSLNYLVREHIGAAAGVVPWNTPFLMAGWKIDVAQLEEIECDGHHRCFFL